MNDPQAMIDEVAERIRALSGEGRLPAERALADRLGVNRYVLRKALGQLRAGDEIPASQPRNRGKRRAAGIAAHDIAELTSPAELWEVRLSLEPELARLAAVRGTTAEIEAIAAAHARSQAAVFDLEIDIAFHRAIAVASHNALALHLMEQVMDVTRDPAFRQKFPAFTAETGWRHHQMLVDAIRTRHATEAEEAMRLHLTAILQWLNGGADPGRYALK
ncbi:FadR/GntR family transcriptional regulator [Frigidibacter sp. MR17.24]|uniref:FadR/GntR family transcriptional regulator n=1 Tax=Frigidibacter sp. MR17.24 TaxID=3127345 RepID=UPI003012BAE1